MRIGDSIEIQGYLPSYNGLTAEVVAITGSYILVRLDNGGLLELLDIETTAVPVDTLW